MSLLKTFVVPRLKDFQSETVLKWSKEICDFLDDRTGQIILPFGTVSMVNGINHDVVIPAVTAVTIKGPTSSFSIDGLGGGMQGRLLFLGNGTGNNMSILDWSLSGSQPANTIETVVGTTVNCKTAILLHTGVRWLMFAER